MSGSYRDRQPMFAFHAENSIVDKKKSELIFVLNRFSTNNTIKSPCYYVRFTYSSVKVGQRYIILKTIFYTLIWLPGCVDRKKAINTKLSLDLVLFTAVFERWKYTNNSYSNHYAAAQGRGGQFIFKTAYINKTELCRRAEPTIT